MRRALSYLTSNCEFTLKVTLIFLFLKFLNIFFFGDISTVQNRQLFFAKVFFEIKELE